MSNRRRIKAGLVVLMFSTSMLKANSGFFITSFGKAWSQTKIEPMKNIAEIQNELTINEQVTTADLTEIKGGRRWAVRGGCDDKRRQRPGGGSSTSSPNYCY